ncbi:ABC transporter ATP-binding protein [Candidatus Pacearchaeota archaeon]|nr:ABC transporter ATP-binding protein [Candidatus Pacearchaeota archaeon]
MIEKNEAGKGIDFKYNLRLYFGFVKKYKWVFIFLLALILVIEATSVAISFFFKYLVDRGSQFFSSQSGIETFIRAMIAIGIAYGITSLVRVSSKFCYIHYVNKLEVDLIADIKRKFFSHLIELDYGFHTSHKTGSMISKLSRIGGAVERMTDAIIFNFSPMLLQLVVSVFSLIYFDWVSAVITLATVLLFVSFGLFMQKVQEKSNVEANDAEDFEKANVSDVFTNMESIKYFGKERSVVEKFRNLSEITKNKVLANWNYSRWTDSIQALILAIGTFFVIYFPLIDFINGKTTIGTLVFIYSVFSSLFGNLYSFVWGIRGFYRSMADFESLFQYAKISNNVKDKQNAESLKIKNGDIEFKNISFSYDKRKIFENFNLNIPKNKKVALVGHSGSGKSTLIKLLYRLYDVNNGGILIDGKDVREFKQESLRNEMAIVPQECILFDDSIYNNILFSNPKATRQEVIAAIKFAQLDRIIKDFPNKENTVVGERGIKLSGGEKQRVSIARAILANKKILVLDEATSSLDSLTEFEIKKDLEELMKNRTTIIIAHRLSTIMSADIIVVMERGKIVQIGHHNQLIDRQGLYRKLWNMQKGGYIK